MESGVAQFAFRSAKALLACSRMGAGRVLKQDQKLGLGKRRVSARRGSGRVRWMMNQSFVD